VDFRIISLLAGLALLVAACKTHSVHAERPARIVNPSAESHAELHRVVADMLFGAEVTLADDALTDSSMLIVERSRIRSLDNPPLSGRDLGKPERFQLVTTGTRCVLIHENHENNEAARYELLETECVAE
jgi:hypothetical protein